MSVSDILTTLNVLIKLGQEIKDRLDSLNQAAEDLHLLTTNLQILLTVFENPDNENIIKKHVSEFVALLDVLQSIADSCTKCAKALDIEPSGEKNAGDNRELSGKKLLRRIWILNKIPSLLADIQRKAKHLQSVYSAVSVVILQDIKIRQSETARREVTEPQRAVGQDVMPEDLLNRDFITNFASIDLMLGSLMKECQSLRQQLQDTVICPDRSAIEHYEEQNPEGMAFWKDRFQKNELNLSTLRYEVLYVSWARFIHEVEQSIVLNMMPTAVYETGNIDVVRRLGSRYIIKPNGTRRLPTIRPLWLPALQSALDPFHRGYVKPQNYFNFLQTSSLSEKIQALAFENAGYGTLVECERDSSDIALPASIESSSDHVGWLSAQIVAVPTPEELGIATEEEVLESTNQDLFSCFSGATQDIYVYVRYLETGQIERKSLLRQIRPIGGIAVGATLSTRHEFESGAHAWGPDLHVTEFYACYGGQYNITAGTGSNTTLFSTTPIKKSFENMLRGDVQNAASTLPELDYLLLGPSRTFFTAPCIGEKIQIEYDGYWHDSRVTAVEDDEVEFVDWDAVPSISDRSNAVSQDGRASDQEDTFDLLFSPQQLTTLGKGTRRVWQPWRRNTTRYDVRPYRCLHVGDYIDAPVMYPDFRLYYHDIVDSQLHLPARIINVQGDHYVVEFSPALLAHEWWPGRQPKGTPIEVVPGSGVTVENPHDFNRLTVSMDLVRPLSLGPGPVLGVQSAKPARWTSFQGVRLGNLEDLLEKSLWEDDGCP
ncbi:hypothetical protein CDD81_6616 [Ophiocordyceps australis]|uniref:Fungal N-terminal domain-containing protein n=1 Tax=Ophiocordyceps australis TaxID=1399860 RepID=A0A2C5XHK5_9HYPO|nr:hypothetical protein CDD81_6616 [Ophiocordyceps australis]